MSKVKNTTDSNNSYSFLAVLQIVTMDQTIYYLDDPYRGRCLSCDDGPDGYHVAAAINVIKSSYGRTVGGYAVAGRWVDTKECPDRYSLEDVLNICSLYDQDVEDLWQKRPELYRYPAEWRE